MEVARLSVVECEGREGVLGKQELPLGDGPPGRAVPPVLGPGEDLGPRLKLPHGDQRPPAVPVAVVGLDREAELGDKVVAGELSGAEPLDDGRRRPRGGASEARPEVLVMARERRAEVERDLERRAEVVGGAASLAAADEEDRYARAVLVQALGGVADDAKLLEGRGNARLRPELPHEPLLVGAPHLHPGHEDVDPVPVVPGGDRHRLALDDEEYVEPQLGTRPAQLRGKVDVALEGCDEGPRDAVVVAVGEHGPAAGDDHVVVDHEAAAGRGGAPLAFGEVGRRALDAAGLEVAEELAEGRGPQGVGGPRPLVNDVRAVVAFWRREGVNLLADEVVEGAGAPAPLPL